MKPQQFDVMVTPNLYGNLVTNVVSALVGGPGLTPGANIGQRCAVFEAGAHHVASDIAGQDKANPTGVSSTNSVRFCFSFVLLLLTFLSFFPPPFFFSFITRLKRITFSASRYY